MKIKTIQRWNRLKFAPKMLPKANLAALNLFSRPDIESVLSNDEVLQRVTSFLNKGLGNIVNAHSRHDLKVERNEEEMIVRSLASSVGLVIDSLYSNKISLCFEQRELSMIPGRIDLLIDNFSPDQLRDILMFLVTLELKSPKMRKKPGYIEIKEFLQFFSDKTKGQDAFFLPQYQVDLILQAAIRKIRQEEKAELAPGLKEFLGKLTGSRKRKSYVSAVEMMIPSDQMVEAAQSFRGNLVSTYYKNHLDPSAGLNGPIIAELAKMASVRRGLDMTGFSSMDEVRAVNPKMNFQRIAMISLLEYPPRIKPWTYLKKIAYGGILFWVENREIIGADEPREELFIPFTPQATILFAQLSFFSLRQQNVYSRVLTRVNDFINAQINKGTRRKYLKDDSRFTKSIYLRLGLALLKEEKDKGNNLNELFKNKIFWNIHQKEYLKIEDVIEFVGLIGQVPQMLLSTDPMFLHFIFNEKGLLIYDSESGDYEMVPYPESFAQKVMDRIRKSIGGHVKTNGSMMPLPEADYRLLMDRILKNEWERDDPRDLSRFASLRKKIKEDYAVNLWNSVNYVFCQEELESLAELFEFFPRHLLNFIRSVQKSRHIPRGSAKLSLREAVSKTLEESSAFDFYSSQGSLVLNYWDQTMMRFRESKQSARIFGVFCLGLARLIWEHQLTDKQKQEYINLKNLHGVEYEGLFEDFSRNLVYYVRQLNRDGRLDTKNPEEFYFSRLLSPPRLLAAPK
ncbi:MAG: hypothetical protein HQ564_00380 [Candidatus Saganbacteria bacterium]|nr:hypothetical protein [Candidatus Saganbacteria bacterium]